MEESGEKSFFKSLVKVADLPEFVLDPARFYFRLELAQGCCRGIAFLQSRKRSLGRQHPALDGKMNSLQPLRIQKSCRVPEHHPAIARHRRNRPPTAVWQRLRAVADHFPALEQARNKRMLLKILQHVLRIEPRVGIVDPGHKAKRYQVVF